jgi:UDPglucose 6-dehydrogenase
MKIGILGLGVVGSAAETGFRELGHITSYYDPRYENSAFEDVLDTEVCFLCVPTPPDNNGKCDTSIVESSLASLSKAGYTGVAAIKSTVEPGTTHRLIDAYPNLAICFVPEFLRERCAVTDFIENHDLCVVGTEKENVFEIIKKAHGHYPAKVVQLKPVEAEIVKYYNNIYNATLITLANSFYEVCDHLDADYTAVKNALVNRSHITNSYLQCNKNFRGFGGVCLPKDTSAIATLVREAGLDINFFQMLLDENDKYQVTVYDGMRKQ